MDVSVRAGTFEVTVSGPASLADPVLLLHGFPQNSTMWDRVTPLLHGAGFSTITVNQRGYSPAARPADVDAYAIGECVADILAILDDLDVPAAHLVGHDWGAIVAWHVAAEYPDRVRSLVALAVPHPNALGAAIATDPDQQQRSAYFRLFRQQGKAEQVLLEDDGRRLREMFHGCPADRVDRYVGPMLEPGALTAALNWYRAMRNDTMACAHVTIPTTYVWGERDVAIGATAARSCADYVAADFEFVSLDATHWLADEMPERLSEIILSRATGDGMISAGR